MPRGDGTGPMGSGPMSGWGLGRCGDRGELYRYGPGFGGGRRARGGRRRRSGPMARGDWASPVAVPERRALEHEAEALSRELEAVRSRLEELDDHDRDEQ